MHAAIKGRTNIVRMLLKVGASIPVHASDLKMVSNLKFCCESSAAPLSFSSVYIPSVYFSITLTLGINVGSCHREHQVSAI